MPVLNFLFTKPTLSGLTQALFSSAEAVFKSPCSKTGQRGLCFVLQFSVMLKRFITQQNQNYIVQK